MKKTVGIRWGGAFLLSLTVLLLFASHASPVYSLLLGDYEKNTASAAMLIGKCWAEGYGIPYRDLFSMGGPLYYLLQAMGWFIAGRTGIFVLEVISFYLFLGLTAQTMARFVSGKVAAVCAALGAVVLAALCSAGNSTFEWCLPFIAGGYVIVLRPGKPCRNRDAALLGLLCGCVLLIDFRAGGLLYGAALWGVFCSPKEKMESTGKRLACFGIGMAVLVFAAVGGFAAAGDLRRMLQGTFLYPACALTQGFDSLQVILHKGVKCLFLLPLLAAGVLLLLKEKTMRSCGVCLLSSGVVCGVLLLCGDNRWYYYLAALMAVPIGIAVLWREKKGVWGTAAAFVSLLIAALLSVVPLKNSVSFLRAGTPDVINEFYEDLCSFKEENPQSGYLTVDTDCSYFLMLDWMPEYRYFTGQTELSGYDPDVGKELERYLEEGKSDVVFITERGYIGRELDKYALTQVYLEYGGSLFVYMRSQ